MSALGQDAMLVTAAAQVPARPAATTDAMAALRADRPNPSPRLELP